MNSEAEIARTQADEAFARRARYDSDYTPPPTIDWHTWQRQIVERLVAITFDIESSLDVTEDASMA